MRVASVINLTEAQRQRLVRIAQAETTEIRLARRASIVLLSADGLDNKSIGEILGIDRIQVGRWRERYAVGGLGAIARDQPRSGRKPAIDAAEIVRLTTQSTPVAATQWSRALWPSWPGSAAAPYSAPGRRMDSSRTA